MSGCGRPGGGGARSSHSPGWTSGPTEWENRPEWTADANNSPIGQDLRNAGRAIPSIFRRTTTRPTAGRAWRGFGGWVDGCSRPAAWSDGASDRRDGTRHQRRCGRRKRATCVPHGQADSGQQRTDGVSCRQRGSPLTSLLIHVGQVGVGQQRACPIRARTEAASSGSHGYSPA